MDLGKIKDFFQKYGIIIAIGTALAIGVYEAYLYQESHKFALLHAVGEKDANQKKQYSDPMEGIPSAPGGGR